MKTGFDGFGRWEREFSFLEKFGLDSVYLLILGLAQSAKDLRNLIGLLPVDNRLLRNDIIKLEKFWQEEIEPLRKLHHVKRTEQELSVIDWLLLNQESRREKTRGYYSQNLINGATLDVPPEMEGTVWITHPEMMGHGTDHFRISMFGQVFVVGLAFNADLKKIVVRILVWEHRLEEEVTHKLLTLPPYFSPREPWSSGAYGRRVSLGYAVPSESLMPYIGFGNPYCSVKLGFDDTALQALQEIGLPINAFSVGTPGDSVL